MRQRWEDVSSPGACLMINFHPAIFLLGSCVLSHLALVAYHLERDGMPLPDALGNCPKSNY